MLAEGGELRRRDAQTAVPSANIGAARVERLQHAGEGVRSERLVQLGRYGQQALGRRQLRREEGSKASKTGQIGPHGERIVRKQVTCCPQPRQPVIRPARSESSAAPWLRPQS